MGYNIYGCDDMNILVLADGFDKGGLETQVDTYYNELRNDHNIIFGFSNYKKSNVWKIY